MFDHVTICATDRAASQQFYETVLGALGIEPSRSGSDLVGWDDFAIIAATSDRPATRHLHRLRRLVTGGCRRVLAGGGRGRLRG